MLDETYTSYFYYVGNEVKYGCTLYLSGWKKLLLHPIQTVIDTASALYHPIETGKILLNEVRQHPIGVAVNISLAWVTGRAISSSIRYYRETGTSHISDFSTSLAKNPGISESMVSSGVAQVVQVGFQTMSGGCCGGICTTTAARIGQTAALVTSQSKASTENRHKLQDGENSELPKKSSSFLSYFWQTSQTNKGCKSTSCEATTCSTATNVNESKTGLRSKGVTNN